MKTRYDDSNGLWGIDLERGEEINTSVERFCREAGIFAAEFRAIGAVERPTLGYYNLETRVYEWHEYLGIYEATMQGNVSVKDGAPFLHVHPVLSGPDLRAFLGHMKTGFVGVVIEGFLQPLEEPIERVFCPAIGLPRWQLQP